MWLALPVRYELWACAVSNQHGWAFFQSLANDDVKINKTIFTKINSELDSLSEFWYNYFHKVKHKKKLQNLLWNWGLVTASAIHTNISFVMMIFKTFSYQTTFNLLDLKEDNNTEYVMGWKSKGVYSSKLIPIIYYFLA